MLGQDLKRGQTKACKRASKRQLLKGILEEEVEVYSLECQNKLSKQENCLSSLASADLGNFLVLIFLFRQFSARQFSENGLGNFT